MYIDTHMITIHDTLIYCCISIAVHAPRMKYSLVLVIVPCTVKPLIMDTLGSANLGAILLLYRGCPL